MKTILVCGGREFDNWNLLSRTLDNYYIFNMGRLRIVQGGAKGADFLARAWAKSKRTPMIKEVIEYPADWKTYGKAAGPIRNKQMLDEEDVDLVVAFPGGAGTANMVSQARERGIEVIEVEE